MENCLFYNTVCRGPSIWSVLCQVGHVGSLVGRFQTCFTDGLCGVLWLGLTIGCVREYNHIFFCVSALLTSPGTLVRAHTAPPNDANMAPIKTLSSVLIKCFYSRVLRYLSSAGIPCNRYECCDFHLMHQHAILWVLQVFICGTDIHYNGQWRAET